MWFLLVILILHTAVIGIMHYCTYIYYFSTIQFLLKRLLFLLLSQLPPLLQHLLLVLLPVVSCLLLLLHVMETCIALDNFVGTMMPTIEGINPTSNPIGKYYDAL